eukprot:Gregarina_sp_Poly_1__3316@NODE_1954_length_3005_cov_33_233152_g396_i1_p3_GENE_NODE_1954_length_3005_cov_33_233152_g396_i1NODE_1954_length_3005_cov_33_233152_g396_i1_p3_ORF_typecomplete_len118_score6_96_NODE_1954_length_3005_cov_33_233152_g396_i1265618
MQTDLRVLNYVFAAICTLSCVTCLTRFDYNLPLFAVLWWRFQAIPFERRWRQYRYVMALIVLSIIQDSFFVLYWHPKIFSAEWKELTQPINALNSLTMSFTLLILTAKVRFRGVHFA